MCLAVYSVENISGQRNGRAAGSVLFLRVVRFFDRYVVGSETIHQFGQLAVYLEEDVDPDAVVRCVEKGSAVLTAQSFRLVEPLGPARRAAYDRYARLEADTQVVERRRGSRELDRRIDSVQVLGRQIVRPDRRSGLCCGRARRESARSRAPFCRILSVQFS